MQITFESRDADGAQMRDLSTQRLRFVLRRLASFVPHVKLQFSDVNGPRGGVDKRCQVELTTEGVGKLVVASLARDWRTALERSLARAARALKRSLRRTQKPVRNRAAKLALNSKLSLT